MSETRTVRVYNDNDVIGAHECSSVVTTSYSFDFNIPGE